MQGQQPARYNPPPSRPHARQQQPQQQMPVDTPSRRASSSSAPGGRSMACSPPRVLRAVRASVVSVTRSPVLLSSATRSMAMAPL
ncbi:MAG: hypothetical protein WDW36_005308 [Sanguina aurantia]